MFFVYDLDHWELVPVAFLVLLFLVMGDTEYSVIDTSDTTSSGIGIDY